MTFNFQLSTLDFFKRHWLTVVIVVALLVGAWWGFSAWNRARALRLATETGALQSEISNLKRQAAEAEKAAARSGQLAAEWAAKLEKSKVESRKLKAELEKFQADATAEQARIAALTPAQVAAEVTGQVGTPGSEAALRRTLEIIAERDACKDQSTLKDEQFRICRESMVDYAAIGEQQAIQIRDLKQALDLERRAFDKRDDLAKVQVKAGKPSWVGRIWEKVDGPVMLTVGILIGAAATR